MSRSISLLLLLTVSVLAFLGGSCATKAQAPALAPATAATAPAPAKAPEKVAKQRTVVAKVPVLVKESAFYADGLPDEYFVYKLDDAKKNPIEKDSFDPSRSEPALRQVYEYKDGRLAAESTYESDGKLRSRRELGYDSAGLLVQERSVDAKGKVQSSSAYAYDAAGRKVEWRVLDDSGTLKALSSYSYGPDGLVDVVMKDAGGALAGRIKLDYAEGRLVKRSYFGADEALQKYEAYSYDAGKLTAVEYRLADGSFSSKRTYSYGSLGERVKAVESDASGAVGAYSTYEYLVREDSSIETYYE